MFSRYYHTLIHLKPIQIRYQLWYRIRRYWRKLIGYKYPLSIRKEGYPVELKPFIPKYTSFKNCQFTFLNQSKAFTDNNIEWNYKEFGKLWTYNLNYFDFLLQQTIMPEIGYELIADFIPKLKSESTALEPYPIALRGINWIKFISRHCKDDKGGRSNLSEINACLYAQYRILLDNLEYHLLGNHILENGFSLLFGAFYFKDKTLYNKAIEIISSELNEQILDDGGHFELSPMYHQIILDRLLDCINLVQNNKQFDNQLSLQTLMMEKALKMVQWLNYITFSNNQIPLLNDSVPGIAPTSEKLNQYAIRLGIRSDKTLHIISQNSINLSQSGYRRFKGTSYECIIDVGSIGSNYQSGHAHADTFNFALNINNQPFIVDTGISTYNANQNRLFERGTSAHNTVTIEDHNSSDVWSSFRVAQRASVKIIKEDLNGVFAEHNGFRQFNTVHKRNWNFLEDSIIINDLLNGDKKFGKAHFWFGPQLKPIIKDNEVIVANTKLTFENIIEIKLFEKKIPNGFNVFENTFKLEVFFLHKISTIILLKN